MISEYNNQVIDFLVWEGALIFLKGEKLKNRTLFMNKSAIKDKVGAFSVCNNHLLLSTWDPTTYLIDLTTQEVKVKFEGYSCSATSLTTDNFTLSKKANGSREKFTFLIKEEKLVTFIAEEAYLFKNNKIKLKQLSKFELKEENNIWLFESQSPVTINKVIGVYDKLIFIAMSNSDLVALNSDNGSKVWSLNARLRINRDGILHDSQTPNLQVDSQKGCLIHPAIEVGLDGKVKENNYLKKMMTQSAGYWILKGNGAFDFNSNHIVFSAIRRYQIETDSKFLFECHIFVVDRLVDEIVFQYLLNKDSEFKELRKIVLVDREIYTLDHGGTLCRINLDKQIV